MSASLVLFKLILRPITSLAARQSLAGRSRSPGEPEKGRFWAAEVARRLDQTWRVFDELVPDVSREPTVGSRLKVRLAALTLAMLRTLTAAGIERRYAIELIGDTCWNVYQ